MARPRINPDAIERERSAAIPADGGGEAALLFAIRAAGLPEPLTQHHFAWCCEHPKAHHVKAGATADATYCMSCTDGGMWRHAYSHERAWRADFAWPGVRLLVEVDGATWAGGRHTRGAGFAKDCEKQNEAVLRGWRVLRVTTQQVEDGSALAWIERALEES